MFTWLPLYKEVATWILQYRNRQPELCNILQEIGFEKNLTDEDEKGKIPLKVMDPISFFGYFQKPKNQENRKRFWSLLAAREGFTSPIPSDFEGLPSANPMNIWMFKFKKDRKPSDIDDLWDIAEKAIKGQIKASTFNTILSKPGIGVAKLTQGLFWLNPEKYYPIDAHKSYLDNFNIDYEVEDFDDYESVIKQIKNSINKPFYEISHEAWKSTHEEIEDDEKDDVDELSGSFFDKIKKYDPEKFNDFIDTLRSLVKDFNLSVDDKRIVFVVRGYRLNFNVGGRYCINLFRNDTPNYFGFISDKKLPEYDSDFKGSSFAAYYNLTDFSSDLIKYKSSIWNAIKNELSRTRVSKSIKYDDPDFRSHVFQMNVERKESSISLKNETLAKGPLNRILYGPPGTGKTYLSKRLALSLIEEKTIEEINKLYPTSLAISEQFSKYQDTGQLAFTTFHQSFAYEDFIEGIKPILDKEEKESGIDVQESESNKIGYKIQDGLFKMISDQAGSYKISTVTSADSSSTLGYPIDVHDKQFFKMSLGNTYKEEGQKIYSFCITNNCLALGWGGRVDFSKADTEEKIDKLFEQNGGPKSKYEVIAVNCFRLWMRKGDIVLISDGNLLVRAIAQIESDYYFDPKTSIEPKHFRKVKWLLKDVKIPVNELYEKQFTQMTVYMLWSEEIKKDFFTKATKPDFKSVNHVLIIDEINRGNVSAIFGELISLLEEDKREGSKEALTVSLPYSKKLFSVPDNLFIIGTMNTADRSVEALDTALRRRFVFEEMAPRYDLRELQYKVAGFTLSNILWQINIRLEKLLDKDHKIGHSYFMYDGSSNIRQRIIDTFYKNIIPLLQEYFFGDSGKIGLVLGNGFVTFNKSNSDIFAAFEYDTRDILLEKPNYSIIDYRNSDSIEYGTFEKAIETLMNSGRG